MTRDELRFLLAEFWDASMNVLRAHGNDDEELADEYIKRGIEIETKILDHFTPETTDDKG